MFQKALSSLLILLTLLIGFQQAIMILQFKINQQQIEAVYCTNKNKPELACHGTCFLKKKLAESREKQADQQIINPIIHLILTEPMLKLDASVFDLPKKIRYIFPEKLNTPPILEVFIPPPTLWISYHFKKN